MTAINSPLISIIIPVYNSEKYVIEALDSTLDQGYDNIELVISDDKSTDESIALIHDWLEKNKKNFVNASFHIQKENLGVRDNTNFLIEHSRGEYIRLLEADDILVQGSIKSQVEYVVKNPEAKFLFSDLLIFSQSLEEAKVEKGTNSEFIKADANQQYEMLLYGQKANGPSVFFQREMMKEQGAYIGARNCADWTTVIKLAKNGVKLHYLEIPSLYYRRHDSNISTRESESWKQVSYEMKSIRNNLLFTENLAFKHKLYCYQDLIVAKKSAKKALTFKERLLGTFSRKLYRLIK